MKHLFALVLFFSISFTLLAQDITIKIPQDNTVKSPKPIATYSKSVTSSGFVFISGQIGIDPVTNELVNSDFRQEVTQVMNNIGAVLKENGLSFNNVVKCTVYLTDISNYGLMNEVYASYFKDKFPAREAVQVVKLPKNANVEISAIAAP